MTEFSDKQIIDEFKKITAEHKMSQWHALQLLKQTLETYKAGIDMPVVGERAIDIEEIEISEVPPSEWPDWAQALVPAKSKFELHTFPSGRVVARLLNPRHLLLLAQELEAESA